MQTELAALLGTTNDSLVHSLLSAPDCGVAGCGVSVPVEGRTAPRNEPLRERLRLAVDAALPTRCPSGGEPVCSRSARERKLHEFEAAAGAELRSARAALQAAQQAARHEAAAPGEAAGQPSLKRVRKDRDRAAEAERLERERQPPLPRVEVALQTEGLPSWYEATVVGRAEGRCKVQLLLRDKDDALIIEGRDREEWVDDASVRPLPPRDEQWMPKPGELCEFLYLDGWWPVKVKRSHTTKSEGEKWEVVYEAHNAKHRATRDKLRPLRPSP
mmetsp:Transcript_15330/g.49559  ORF Transcript_15330/g.49559 Transcript_15330/m.49559 type:complete len:273 (+) Transcript_15330:6-824(+)